jgi:6-phosphofructokinase 2
MSTIACLAMNPALDVSTATEAVLPTHKLRCDPPKFEAGGGGVNVARAICALGGEAIAVFPAGGASAEILTGLLDRQSVPHRRVHIRGATRESLTVDERRSGKQFRFVLPGPRLTSRERQTCLAALANLRPNPKYLVASGSLPPGVPTGFLRQVADLAAGVGARLILDTSAAPLRRLGAGAYLMKPSIRELREISGKPLKRRIEQAAAAASIIEQGLSEVVVVSLGADGALLVTADGYEKLDAPAVAVRSAVGAGDSMVGAITLGLDRGMPLRRAVLFGVAAGAAALLTPGAALCREAEVRRLFAALEGRRVQRTGAGLS